MANGEETHGKELLNTLTHDRLGDVPAQIDERDTDVRDPGDSSREPERGRRPEEVVQDCEARSGRADGDGRPDDKAVVTKKYKVNIDGADGERVVKELISAWT